MKHTILCKTVRGPVSSAPPPRFRHPCYGTNEGMADGDWGVQAVTDDDDFMIWKIMMVPITNYPLISNINL